MPDPMILNHPFDVKALGRGDLALLSLASMLSISLVPHSPHTSLSHCPSGPDASLPHCPHDPCLSARGIM
ncbi:hypothetical protein E2C01_073177 [Portunus trituberculatus]|uniref:Uncharacterized protein n=1 Tax=Portunus trituberculatus TaxID=210409 RepID=A0A5B7I8R4_PORTR|nr:hypothetical protein [Portunus trituberculatus]